MTIMSKIVVVDDEPDLEMLVLQRFRRQIRDGSIAFLFASDGVEALALIDEHPDVAMVVSDINMPRMDGLTLLEKLQEAGADLFTVIVSAYGDMSKIRTAMNRGAFDFLTKPIDFGDLQSTIERTVRQVEIARDARKRLQTAEKARMSLARYFSPELAERLAEGEVDLTGQRREVSAIFTDIAGFTMLAETIEPALLAGLINDYLGLMTDVVFAHGGTITKIIGDALHVLFNAPGDQPDHVTRAVKCALALDACAEAFRARWSDRVALGETRIGVHTGPAIVGNFGGGRFFDYSAYGDTINTTARLEAVNKQLGTRICVSAAVAAGMPGFSGRPVGDLILRGRTQPLRVYQPLAADACTDPATAAYTTAFAKLEAGDPAALASFAALVGWRPDIGLASFHLKRLLNGGSGTVIRVD